MLFSSGETGLPAISNLFLILNIKMMVLNLNVSPLAQNHLIFIGLKIIMEQDNIDN